MLRWRAVGLLVAAIAVLVVVWIVATGLSVRSKLDTARSDMAKMKAALLAGNPTEAVRMAQRLRSEADSAHARTSGPAWWAAAQLPWLGGPVRSWRDTARDVDALARTTLPFAVRVSTILAPDRVVTKSGGIDLAPLHAAIAPLASAQAAAARIGNRMAADRGSSWLGSADSTRAKAMRDVTRLRDGLGLAVQTLQIAPSMLGADGPRRYFVAFENDAEARGLGGLPGAYGILRVDAGRFTFVRFGSQYDLLHARSTAHLGADFQDRYAFAFKSNTDFRNSDASPHFPYDAATWLSMWQNQFHQHLDGAIATDPTALSYLLRVAGSVTLSDGQQLTTRNAVQVLESDIYRKFPGLGQSSIAARKDYLVGAAQAIVGAITSHLGDDPHALVGALAQAVKQGRLLVYSTDSAEQSQLEKTRIAGVLPRTADPFVALVVNNNAGSKLDYYLDQRLRYQRSTCAATTSTVTVTLHNDAPAHGLPPYVTYTNGFGHAPPGTNYEAVSLYLTQGADLDSVTLDGKKQFLQRDDERGHPVIMLTLSLRPGQTRTLVYKVREPAAHGPVQIPVQPLVRGLVATVDAPDCVNG